MMAKNIRRMLAMFLVLSMFVGAMPLQALATDGTETKTEDGVTTSTTTSTSGNTVTVKVESNGTKESTGDKVESSSTTTTTQNNTSAKQETTTESQWNSTVTSPTTTTDNTTSSTTTTTNGSETSTTTTEKDGKDTVTSGKTEGQETTTTTTTTTTTEKKDYETNGSGDPDGDGEYVDSENDWITTEGDPKEVEGVLDGNHLEGDAEVVLTPGTETKTEEGTGKEYVEFDEVKFELGQNGSYVVDILPEGLTSTTNEDGTTTHTFNGKPVNVVEEIKDGKLTYTITPIVEQTEGNGGSGSGSKPSYKYREATLDDTYKAVPKLEGATEKTGEDGVITETGKDADGNDVTITRTPVKDEDGKILSYEVVKTTTINTTDAEGNGELVEDKKETDSGSYTKLPNELKAATVNGETLKFESILDEDGNHVGYKATDKDGKETIVNDEKFETSYEANGLKTTVTVTKVMKDGKHVGYTTTTVVTDKDGKEVSMRADTIGQTEGVWDSETNTYKQLTVNTETVTVTGAVKESDVKDIYQMVETEDGLFLLYQGKMYKVEGTVTESEEDTFIATGDGNGTVKWGTGSNLEDLRMTDSNGYYTGFDSPAGNKSDVGDFASWQYIGYGLFSNLKAWESTGNDDHRIRQFKMEGKNGEIVLAYCVEMGPEMYGGIDYTQADFGKNEGKDSTAIEGGGTVGNLRSILTNGFWGTESGLGSLEAVKELMRRNGLGQYADIMTPGMAMVATQVAVWEYGKDNKHINEEFGAIKVDANGNPLTDTYIDENGNVITYETGAREYFKVTGYNNSAVTEEEQAAIGELRNLLIKLSKNPEAGQAEKIEAEDFSGKGIVLKEYDEETKTYTADVKFGLDVSTSSLNGDLIVKVMVDGEAVKTVRLAGDNEHTIFGDLVGSALGTIQPDANGVFTIEDVELADGQKFTLNLEGIQHLDEGVYMFHDTGVDEYNKEKNSKKDYQDFVSLSKKDVDVNLSIDMCFETVEDPNFKHLHQEKNAIHQNKSTTSKEIGYTIKVTNLTETVVEEALWRDQFQNRVTTPGGRTGRNGGNGGGAGNGLTIPDEPVPLAAPPKTGDMTGMWLGMIMLIGMGLYAVNFNKKNQLGSF